MSRITSIVTGSTLVSSAVPDAKSHKWNLAYTDLFQSKKKRIEVPVKCFLVEAMNHRLLIDAGWSELDAKNPKKHLGFALYFASEPVLKKDQSAIGILSSKGLKPTDIEAILMTHLDCDHVSGLDDFPSSQRVICSKEEYDYSKENKMRYGKLAKGKSFDFLIWKEDVFAPFGVSSDVFLDGSVIAYLTPTHSKGSVIYMIRGDKGFVLLVGDNGYMKNSWERGIMPGVIYNKDNMAKALEWIQAKSKDHSCKGVYCAHDPIMYQDQDF